MERRRYTLKEYNEKKLIAQAVREWAAVQRWLLRTCGGAQEPMWETAGRMHLEEEGEFDALRASRVDAQARLEQIESAVRRAEYEVAECEIMFSVIEEVIGE